MQKITRTLLVILCVLHLAHFKTGLAIGDYKVPDIKQEQKTTSHAQVSISIIPSMTEEESQNYTQTWMDFVSNWPQFLQTNPKADRDITIAFTHTINPALTAFCLRILQNIDEMDKHTAYSPDQKNRIRDASKFWPSLEEGVSPALFKIVCFHVMAALSDIKISPETKSNEEGDLLGNTQAGNLYHILSQSTGNPLTYLNIVPKQVDPEPLQNVPADQAFPVFFEEEIRQVLPYYLPLTSTDFVQKTAYFERFISDFCTYKVLINTSPFPSRAHGISLSPLAMALHDFSHYKDLNPLSKNTLFAYICQKAHGKVSTPQAKHNFKVNIVPLLVKKDKAIHSVLLGFHIMMQNALASASLTQKEYGTYVIGQYLLMHELDSWGQDIYETSTLTDLITYLIDQAYSSVFDTNPNIDPLHTSPVTGLPSLTEPDKILNLVFSDPRILNSLSVEDKKIQRNELEVVLEPSALTTRLTLKNTTENKKVTLMCKSQLYRVNTMEDYEVMRQYIDDKQPPIEKPDFSKMLSPQEQYKAAQAYLLSYDNWLIGVFRDYKKIVTKVLKSAQGQALSTSYDTWMQTYKAELQQLLEAANSVGD